MHTSSREAYGRASDELEETVRQTQASSGSGSSAPTGFTGASTATGSPGASTVPGVVGSSAATGPAEANTAPSGGASSSGLSEIGGDLYGMANALAEHIDLRRPLVDPSFPENGRVRLVDAVFGGKVGATAVSLLTTVVRHRVSTSTDLVEVIEDLARDALLAAAEKDGTLSEVEDELFRFGRLLEREPRLQTLLSDSTVPPAKRGELLDSVLANRSDPITHQLLAQLVRRPYSRPLDRGAEVLAEAAASRRDRSIARVTSPVVLGEQQEQRLAQSLSSLYGRQISVHVDVDPEILGGLVIHVGGEVIDGSVIGRLRGAENALPG